MKTEPQRLNVYLIQLLTGFFIFAVFPAIANNVSGLSLEVPDSLMSQINRIRNKVSKADYLLNLAEDNCYDQPELANFFIEWVLDLSLQSKSEFQNAKAFFLKAKILERSNRGNEQLQKSRKLAIYCEEVFAELKENFWLARAQNLLASIAYNFDNYSLADSQNTSALQVLRSTQQKDRNHLTLLAEIYNTQACINYMDDFAPLDSTFLLFDKSYSIYEAIDDKVGMARILSNKAYLKSDSTSTSMYQKAALLYQQYGSKEDLAQVYMDHSQFCIENYRLNPENHEWFTQSNLLLKQAAQLNSGKQCSVIHLIGQNSHELLAEKESVDEDLLLQTLNYYQQALDLAVEQENANCLSKMAEDVRKICGEKRIPNLDCASFLNRLANAYDAILTARQDRIEEAQNDIHRYERSQLELTSRNFRNRAIYSGLALSLLFFVTLRWQMLEKHRKEQQAQIQVQEAQIETQEARIKSQKAQIEAKEARLQAFKERLSALRAQIEPHFISNTLNAIDSLVNQNRVDEASSYIVKFSRLSRMILESSKSETISLDEEITILQHLIALEKLRLGDMLTYTFDVQDDLNLESIEIPPMLLQPFIENAIWHGIQKKEAPGKLEIIVRKPSEEELELIVRDDGIGRTRAKQMQKKSLLDQKSWGMNITRERIETIPKMKGAQLNIIDLQDNNGQPAGTEVRIRLPISYAEPQVF